MGWNGILADWMTRNKNVAHNEIVNSTVLRTLSSIYFYPKNLSFGKPITWIPHREQKQKDNKGLARKCHQSSLAKQSDSFVDELVPQLMMLIPTLLSYIYAVLLFNKPHGQTAKIATKNKPNQHKFFAYFFEPIQVASQRTTALDELSNYI